MEKDTPFWLGFNKISGLGPVKLYGIFKHFGSLENAWNSDISEFKNIQCLNESNFKQIEESRKEIIPEKEVEYLVKNNIQFLLFTDENYPECLKNIHDPPLVLYYKGIYDKKRFEKSIGIVGTREPSFSGKKISHNFAFELSELGVSIISGMAKGIDTEAHKGALKSDNGYTVAVLGSGVGHIYPPQNNKLYNQIIEKGLVVSTYYPEAKPDARNFPPRNRIISGLSNGVLVIEAGEKSGSLITVDFATEQGRDVFSVPGDILNPMSKGTNNLIKQGSIVVTDISDIIDSLNWKIVTKNNKINIKNDYNPHIENLNLSEREKEVYMILENIPQHLDKIVSRLELPMSDVSINLLTLELKQLVKQLPGNLFVKV